MTMLMTEEEAKDKWCPMVRVDNKGVSVNDGVFVRNDGEVLGRVNTCIASKCAVWRNADHPLGLHGYCGLAGIPRAE